MKIQSSEQGFLIIDDCFSQEELQKIWTDIEYIEQNNLFKFPTQTGSAKDPLDGAVLKKNKAIFLDRLTNENKIFHILSITSKFFCVEIAEIFRQIHPGLSIFENLNYSHSLLSYYENEDYYKSHIDNSVFTMLSWIYREPKCWTGGNLILNEYDIEIECKNNRTLIIPGSFFHSVETLNMIENQNCGMGRYCITTFAFVKPTRN